MATFKACVRTPRNDGLYSVFIRVTHNRVARYIATNKTIDISFSKYAMRYVFSMADDWGMKRNSNNYKWALMSLEKFLEKKNVMFSDLTTTTIQNWINSLSKTSGARRHSAAVCLRICCLSRPFPS